MTIKEFFKNEMASLFSDEQMKEIKKVLIEDIEVYDYLMQSEDFS